MQLFFMLQTEICNYEYHNLARLKNAKFHLTYHYPENDEFLS